MKKIRLEKQTLKNGKFVYTAIADGKEIYKSSPTARTYVAMICSQYGAIFRFGRLDLIGKGDSRPYYEDQTYPYLAVVEEIEKLVYIPSKPKTTK